MSADQHQDVPVEYTDSGEQPPRAETGEGRSSQPDSDVTDGVSTEPEVQPEGEDSLIQLPEGATFGMDHEPSGQEREELVRYAAEADAELREHGQDRGEGLPSSEEQVRGPQDDDAASTGE